MQAVRLYLPLMNLHLLLQVLQQLFVKEAFFRSRLQRLPIIHPCYGQGQDRVFRVLLILQIPSTQLIPQAQMIF